MIDHENQFERISSLRAYRSNRVKKASLGVDKRKEHENQLQRIRYKVKKGDSLVSIAEKFDVEISMIKKWNPKGGNKIKAGSSLTLFVLKGNSEKEKKNGNGKSGKSNHRKSKREAGEGAMGVSLTMGKSSLF